MVVALALVMDEVSRYPGQANRTAVEQVLQTFRRAAIGLVPNFEVRPRFCQRLLESVTGQDGICSQLIAGIRHFRAFFDNCRTSIGAMSCQLSMIRSPVYCRNPCQ